MSRDYTRKKPFTKNSKHRAPNKKKQAAKPRAPELKNISDTRALSALLVYAVCINQKSLNALLPLTSHQVDEKDRALLQEIVFGSCRWFFWLKTLYQPLLSKPIHRNDFLVECLLCTGLYQLLFTRIPTHACLNETVEAAEILGLGRFKGLINALLRQISQQEINTEDNETHQAMVISSHPEWFKDKLKHNWPEQWLDILEQNNQHPPMTLRINPAFFPATAPNTLQQHYLRKLNEQGISATASVISPYGIILEHPCSVQSLPDFAEGGVSIQDEAAQLSSELLDLKPNLRVLDACAAPGGKTCAMLEKESSISVLALDSDATRAERIKENLTRLKLQAEIKIAPAENLSAWWDGIAFDRILLDAPCSATGVIRRHPDIKLLRHEGDIKQLAELQLQLITTLWETLAPGGLIVYATCSVFSQENSRIIERFLKQTGNAKILPINTTWGTNTEFGTQLFPSKKSHDGFFYARLQKSAPSKENETQAQQNI
jgi:16S rRNA (cytosine967-C5)-methyltransferase